MALDAVHIRSRSRSPDEALAQPAIEDEWQRLTSPSSRRPNVSSKRLSLSSSQPVLPTSRRPGIGSAASGSRGAADDLGWHSLWTGESLAASALRMRHRFVRATGLSDPDQTTPSKDDLDSTEPLTESTTGTTAGMASVSDRTQPLAPTLAQLYSELAENMPASGSSLVQSNERPVTDPSALSGTELHWHAKDLEAEQEHQHAHRHRHHPEARQRSEWFINRALTKMRRGKNASSTTADQSDLARGNTDAKSKAEKQSKASGTSRRQRCPRCGDLLPLNATAEDLARHRQSIGHRLGINAPVSSASASEAPSPAASEAPTPAPRSRYSSPDAISLLDASLQALHRRSEKLPRRLSNTPRWKKISRDNVGHNLLSRMGWKEGMGLGVQEWKWQQLKREKLKRQRSNAVRALLQRSSTASQDLSLQTSSRGASFNPGVPSEAEWLEYLVQQNSEAALQDSSTMQTAFPFQYAESSLESQRQAASAWLSAISGSDREWHQCLTVDEQQALEQALLSGQVTLEDVQNAVLAATERRHFYHDLEAQPDQAQTDLVADDMEGVEPSSAMLYPIQVQLRNDRGGIGNRPRRRSREAEGNVEIRGSSSSSGDALQSKKLRPISPTRPFNSPDRSRSHHGSRTRHDKGKQVELTRRQRELAYQKDKQEWLDLRASLS